MNFEERVVGISDIIIYNLIVLIFEVLKELVYYFYGDFLFLELMI